MMDPEVKQQWMDELRSDNWPQGVGALRQVSYDGEDGKPHYTYCCLGVLCELHRRAVGGAWDGNLYLQERTVLPAQVVEWAGLGEYNPTIDSYVNEEGIPGSLAGINDSGYAFPQIAELIGTDL